MSREALRRTVYAMAAGGMSSLVAAAVLPKYEASFYLLSIAFLAAEWAASLALDRPRPA